MSRAVAHVGFAAPSGTGKTTLLTRLLPVLRARGLRLGYLKHAHHGFDLDTPGKDSYLLREAGASAVLIASSRRWALMQEGLPESERAEHRAASATGQDAPRLFDSLLSRFDPHVTDLVLIEGWHGASFPRIAVHRTASGLAFSRFDDPDLIAVATDAPEQVPGSLPKLALGEPEVIADFILNHPRVGLSASESPAPSRSFHDLSPACAPSNPREQLVFYYGLLRRHGYNDAQSGNASVRTDNGFLITPTGAGGDDLSPHELVACPLSGPIPEGASFDSLLHQLVYLNQPEARAILHSHGPYSIAASCGPGGGFMPVDFEGKHYFSQVPIVPIPDSFEDYIRDVPRRVSSALSASPIAMVSSHGVYAWGRTLREAYRWTGALEHSAQIKHLLTGGASQSCGCS
ncbi:molybdopterin-guanine dinucleotide biosynthesis protein B [Thiorhodovibrio frisius]|uniref:Molybdopterin-guanine dinucleotide biosynthesis protein MobB n=1 Tax=Thiorhodovibrio frisius TaxID=631362 RepID=H8YY23_9GAMM|nr:molybdopterin-guanine dinucleotide biosynthesis protein B [Thiorhodovibrio frisius]EIC23349.1 molybdopterin-guanine dinucleotide biosynthesis protein MobB [Thiorhodovibrio frisius]WPL23571.1 Molybdopterin-guanine dinucleotide biosynthesis protein B [Thiorhodovibrio frisius]